MLIGGTVVISAAILGLVGLVFRRCRLARRHVALATLVVVTTAAMLVGVAGQGAGAIATPVPLGTAADFAVLGGQSVTNTGPTVVTGDTGVSPGTSITGFPPGIVNGTIHAADAVALQAQTDLTTAYNNAAGQAPDATVASGELGGLTLTPGVYTDGGTSPLALTGTLTLDAQGDPNAVFVFQSTSTLITASASSVLLINGGLPCNVFWQVASSATIGTGSTFVGTIMALTSITMTTGATLDGRALARNGSVTLDTNVITRSDCAVIPPVTTTSSSTTTTSSTTTSSSTIAAETTTIPAAATTVAPISPPTTSALATVPATGLPATGREVRGAAALATAMLVLGAAAAFMARRKVSPGR